MFNKNKNAFSSNSLYFACLNSGNKLLIWETSSQTIYMDCTLDPNIYGMSSSLCWISLHCTANFPKKALQKSPKKSSQKNYENLLLAVGTTKGDILLYNINNKNLCSHLQARHDGAVNDMDFYGETSSFFTCSDDKSIAVWDLLSGKLKLKWIADSNPISSICVLDENNIISASSSIFWWTVSDSLIIKKFETNSTEVFKLLPINASSLNSAYFLSVAHNDLKINAWSLNSSNTQMPVASFIPSGQPEDVDVSKFSSKDKPLILSVVTEDGFCHFYEHTLNGNIDKPLYPKATVEINSKKESTELCCMSCKLSSDSKVCIIAYKDSEKMMFRHIDVIELFKEFENINTKSTSSSNDRLSLVKESCKNNKSFPLNGLNSPKSTRSPTNKKGYLLTKSPKTVSSKVSKNNKILSSSRDYITDSDINRSHQSIQVFLKSLQTKNDDLIDIFLFNQDKKSISQIVKYFPVHTLTTIIEEINKRLQHNEKYSSILGKWLKEILNIHLNYLIQSKDTSEIIESMKDFIQSKKTSETISKIATLKGLLSLHKVQAANSYDSDSESEVMET